VVTFNKKFRLDVTVGIDRYLKLYEHFISTAKARLTGYFNDEWLFLNPHRYIRNELLERMELGDGVHFSDAVQAKIADHLAPKLFDYICSRGQ
jgi:lysophospholipase L1-like esterase